MKRILVLMLVAVMVLSGAALCAGANDVNESVEYRDDQGILVGEPQGGIVPKLVGQTVAIDGNMEAFYQQGLKANISMLNGNLDKPVSGTVYMLYDDNYLYAFIECNDADAFNIMDLVTICDVCGKQRGVDSRCAEMAAEGYAGDKVGDRKVNLWDDDCVEFMIDWSNDGSTPSQYRISRSGVMSRDYDTAITGFSGKGQDFGSTWNAEFAIGLDSSVQGTQLGITVMIHSQNELSAEAYNETWAMMNNSSAYGTPWHPQFFDWIELGAPLTIDPNITTGTTTGTTSDDTEVVVITETETDDDGKIVVVTRTEYQTIAPTKNDDPAKTADPIVLIVLAAVVALGAAVVVKKTCFNK